MVRRYCYRGHFLSTSGIIVSNLVERRHTNGKMLFYIIDTVYLHFICNITEKHIPAHICFFIAPDHTTKIWITIIKHIACIAIW